MTDELEIAMLYAAKARQRACMNGRDTIAFEKAYKATFSYNSEPWNI